MNVRRVVSTNGYRLHMLAEDCWCRPRTVWSEAGEVLVHKNICADHDDQPRMTVYSDRLAQGG